MSFSRNGGEEFALPIAQQVKVVVVGTWGSGKSALLARYLNDTFADTYQPSKADNASFDVTVSGEPVHFGVWDTAGRASLGASTTPHILPQTDVAVVCFSLVRPHTLVLARKHARLVRDVAGEKTPLVFAGCMLDLCAPFAAANVAIAAVASVVRRSGSTGDLHSPPAVADKSGETSQLLEVDDDHAALDTALVQQADIDELLAEFGPDHATYRACSALTGEGVPEVSRQMILRGLVRAKQRMRELDGLSPPPPHDSEAPPVDLGATGVSPSTTVAVVDSDDDDANALSSSMPAMRFGEPLREPSPPLTGEIGSRRRLAISFDMSDGAVVSGVLDGRDDKLFADLRNFAQALDSEAKGKIPPLPKLDVRDQNTAILNYLFSTAGCFWCERTIEFGALRHHCFEDECKHRVDICSPCLAKHGHIHKTYPERVWVPADMNWRLTGVSVVHTMLNVFHFFRHRPAVGKPVLDAKTGECVRFDWWTFGEVFRRACLLVVAMRCGVGAANDDSEDSSSDDEENRNAGDQPPLIDPQLRVEFRAALPPGVFVGLLSENRREFYPVDLGCQLAGLVTVPIHTAYNAPTMAHVLDDSGVVVLFCTHSQLAPAVAAARLSTRLKLRFFVVIDDDAVTDGAARAALTAANGVAPVLLLSALTADRDPYAAYGRFYMQWQPRDLFALSYTSGSTGTPKGVMECAKHFQQQPTAVSVCYRTRSSSCFVSFEPLAHSQRSNDWAHLSWGGRLGMFDGAMGNAFFQHLRVLRPTSFSGVPRLYNVIYGDYRRALAERLIEAAARNWPRLPPSFECDKCGEGIVGARFSCRMCDWDWCDACMQSARRRREITECPRGHMPRLVTEMPSSTPSDGDKEWEERTVARLAADFVRNVPPNVFSALFSVDGEAATAALVKVPTWKALQISQGVLSEMREWFGGELQSLTTGGAPTAPAVMDFLRALFKGARITNSYGITEVGGITWDGAVPNDSVVVKLADVPELGYLTSDKPWPRGEILVKHPSMALGYYNDAERTAAAFDADGFFHTGDVAEQRSDGLFIIDRCKNIIKLSQGEFVSPPALENTFLVSSLIRAVFVVGDSLRSSLVAVVLPEAEAALRVLVETGDDKVLAALERAVGADADQRLRAAVAADEAVRAALAKAVLLAIARIGTQQALPSYAIPTAIFVAAGEQWTEASGMTASGKIDRGALRARYKAEIAALWAQVDASADQAARRTDAAVRAALGDIGAVAGGENDALGVIDSLSAVRLVSKLRRELAVDVSLRDVLAPGATMASLKGAVTRATSDAVRSSTTQGAIDVEAESAVDLDALMPATRDELTASRRQLWPIGAGVRNILLTGVTGHVGAHLLVALQRQFPSATVWCVVRPGGGIRTAAAAAADGDAPTERDFELPPSAPLSDDDANDEPLRAAKRRLAEAIELFEIGVDAARVRVLAGDIAQPRYALSRTQWVWLAHNIDAVVHNGAVVNAVLPYESLRDANVGGTREALALCGTVVPKPLVYVSTLSILENEPFRRANATLPAWLGATLDGYALSKFVGEQLVRSAAVRIPALVCRLGTVFASTVTGAGNPRAYIDRLLSGVLAAQAYPDALQTRVQLNAIPVDRCVAAIARAMTFDGARGETLHLTGVFESRESNTNLTYERAFEALARVEPKLQPLPFEEWRERVLDGDDADRSPLGALRHYFMHNFPAAPSRTETEHTVEVLRAMNAEELLRPPTADDVVRVAQFYKRKNLY
jgi:thioester reductase-like protein